MKDMPEWSFSLSKATSYRNLLIPLLTNMCEVKEFYRNVSTYQLFISFQTLLLASRVFRHYTGMEFTLHEVSVRAQALKDDFYPWLDAVHITLTVMAVRKEAGLEFSRNHPFATWLASIVASFAGSVIANPLLGNLKKL